MNAVVYDASVLIAAEKGQRKVWTFHRRLQDKKIKPIVPAAVLVEVWRGNSPRLAQFLKGTRVLPLNEIQARAAGRLLAKSTRRSRTSVADACVVLAAVNNGAAIATRDQKDIAALIDGNNLNINVGSI